MKIAIISDNAIQIGDYWDLFPNTSFGVNGPSDEWLTENSCKKVNLLKEHDSLTQKVIQCDPYIVGEWVSTVSVIDLTEEEIASAKANAMIRIRSTRDALLTTCDWTQIPDVSIAKKTEWATYRQALRDLPNTITTDPRTWNEWPINPDSPDYVDLEKTNNILNKNKKSS